MENFDKKLNNYARLIIEKGINANDRPIVIRCAVERADFARLLVKYAYERGCSEVIMEWNDDAINRMYYENASEKALKDFPDFIVEKSKYYFEKKAGVISVSCQDPENLKGVDPDRVQMRSKV
ncbi:MAG: aminopeptidase, partial [Finegoldia magna]|nr:aminopeptidase [Finegoldia magna]